MKISFITTLLNEESTIVRLIESLLRQSKLPHEIIIVDGGSTDATASVISRLRQDFGGQANFKFKIIVKKGNRAVGRNEAIRNASGDIIVCSDSGCTLDKNWLQNITEHFNDPKVDVVAGYYKGKPRSIFEKCLVPYVLVMEDKISPKNFLPASRSMAFRKSIWKKVGGFPEEFSHNEDYVFAQKLKKANVKIVFNKDAIIHWMPRKNIKEAFIMFFRFALGDAEAGIYRSKVLLVFARYLLLHYLLFLAFVYKSVILLFFIAMSLFVYKTWSIVKNYKYVKNKLALFYLPLMQFTSDFAVLLGTSIGLIKYLSRQSLLNLTVNYKAVSIVIGIYIITMLSVLNWGIPNPTHPFPYHMDEWHQLQAVRAVFKYGTPNVEGAANGTMFQFFLSGIYLLPFIMFGIVNPFAITSAIGSLEVQERLFQIMRLNSLFFGVLSILVIVYIAKRYFKISPFLTAFLFTVNPLWISLSNYFKYDIALTFWLVLSIKFLLSYGKDPTLKKYCYAGIVCSLALSTKISALPLIPIYILAFIIYSQNIKKKLYHLIFGLLVLLFTFILFGIPDLIFGKGDIKEYLYSNLVVTPKEGSNLILGTHYLVFLLAKNFPASFGKVLFCMFILAFILGSFLALKKIFSLPVWQDRFWNLKKHKMSKAYRRNLVFLYVCLIIFSFSLIPLGFDARGNRLLVLLPFITIITGGFVTNIFSNLQGVKKNIFLLVFSLALLFQIFETLAWISVKFKTDPRRASSIWIERNISKGSLIGIENIPIYQSLPDIVLKEYYDKQYNQNVDTKYNYRVIDYRSKVLPNIIIVTNDEVVDKYLKISPKKLLLKRLKREKYRRIARFQPDYSYFKFIGDELIFFYSQIPASLNTVSLFSKTNGDFLW